MYRSSGVALAVFLVAGAAEAGAPTFRRVATLPGFLNNSDPDGETASEIIAASGSGAVLVYTDALLGEIGFIDVADPHAPAPAGKLGLDGSPTSVAVLGDELALVVVDTSASPAEPSGHLAVVDIAARLVLAELPLGGQPDSLAIAPSGRHAAVAIENQRDEDVVVGALEGGLPQAPGGFLAIVDLGEPDPAAWRVRRVELAGLASLAPEDPEPEFVDINERDEAVVTLQENNHVVVVDLPSGAVLSHFSAGNASLSGVDVEDDDEISLSGSLEAAREPDAVAWLPGPGGGHIATANEGDLLGGSRGFSIFDRAGGLLFDSGSSFEELAVRHGHYPEARSDNKGTEPEAIERARVGGTDYLFVGSERGNFVAVYTLSAEGAPELLQLLPAPLGPEGVLAVPERGLLIVSGEDDSPPFGVRSSVMIYELGGGAPTYPQIVSADDERGQPIPWSALSGLAAVPGAPAQLLAVSDAFFSEGRILGIDASRAPARITSAVSVSGGSGDWDIEGITVAPDGSYWLASEGDDEDLPNRLVQTDATGAVLQEVRLPPAIEACRAASGSRDTLGAGFEGVAAVSIPGGYLLAVPQQRGWDYTTPECERLDDDPFDLDPLEPAWTRVWVYEPRRGLWTAIPYELEPPAEPAGWVGLSEIAAVPGGWLLIERDDLSGPFAQLKHIVHVGISDLLDGRVERREKRRHDLIPSLSATNGWISDKPEGLAVAADGSTFVVTDNDGLDDWSGETWFLALGNFRRLFD